MTLAALDARSFDLQEHWRNEICKTHPVFSIRLPIIMKDTGSPARSLYFTSFAYWMGAARELMLGPVMRGMARDWETGRWGAATDAGEVRVLGDAWLNDHLELRGWFTGFTDSGRNVFGIGLEWLRLLPNREPESIAVGSQTTAWVSVSEKGEARLAQYPEYMLSYYGERLPASGVFYRPIEGREPVPKFSTGPIVFAGGPGLVSQLPLLFEKRYDTSLEESNFLPVIYFATYYLWQGRARDEFLHSIDPALTATVNQEFVCTRTTVRHLREMHAFEPVLVRIHLKTMSQNGLSLIFEYFRAANEGQPRKVAVGEHDLVWVVGAGEQRKEQPLPESIRAVVEKATRR